MLFESAPAEGHGSLTQSCDDFRKTSGPSAGLRSL